MKGGENEMNDKSFYPLALYLAYASRERDLRAAADERLAPRKPRASVRRSVGQLIVQFGERLAGEPALKPARFR
jgi:hypothetical protein